MKFNMSTYQCLIMKIRTCKKRSSSHKKQERDYSLEMVEFADLSILGAKRRLQFINHGHLFRNVTIEGRKLEWLNAFFFKKNLPSNYLQIFYQTFK